MPLDTIDPGTARDILSHLAQGVPPRGAALDMLVGLEGPMKVLGDDYLGDGGLVKAGGSTVKVVLGGYGCGKTHFFYALEELGHARGYATSFVELHFEECPIESFGRVYRAVLDGLVLPPEAAAVPGDPPPEREQGLRALLDRFARRLEKTGPGKLQAFDELEPRLPTWESWRQEVRDFVAAVERGGDREVEARVVKNLSLDKGSIFGEAEAFRLFAALTRFVRVGLGLAGLILFIDETEERSILERPATQKARRAATNLVEIVNKSHDRTFASALILLSFPWSREQLEEKLRPFPPLLGRLGAVAPLGAADRFGIHILVNPPESDEELFHFFRALAAKVNVVHARLVGREKAPPLAPEVLAVCERFATSVSPERTRRFVKELVRTLEATAAAHKEEHAAE